MKAIRIEEYGGPEILRLSNLELPDLGPGEVHIKLLAAGLNFVDVHLRRGDVYAAGPNFVDVSLRRGECPSSLPFLPWTYRSGGCDAETQSRHVGVSSAATSRHYSGKNNSISRPSVARAFHFSHFLSD